MAKIIILMYKVYLLRILVTQTSNKNVIKKYKEFENNYEIV